APRAGVRRQRLVKRLLDCPPFVVIVAPAGYGKTALLSDWSAADPRSFAWLTLHRGLDDPSSMTRAVTRALATATGQDLVLVLDDVHVLRSQPARDAIAALAAQPPPGVTVVLASRADPPLPIVRLRMQGLLLELRAAELAMTRGEAAAMLRRAGLRFSGDGLDTLMRRTEGWPAGLSLAALALADQGIPAVGLARFDGADRLVCEYVRDEVLAPLSADEREFVTRTAVLDVLTAPLCDAVLERTDSAAMLARLGRAGFPLVGLDRTAERFRHHRLLGEMLRADLHLCDPALDAELHRRACTWHAAAGDRERALRHALAAGQPDRAAELVWSAAVEGAERGCVEPVEHGLSRFPTDALVAHPQLALAAAGTQLAHGRADVAEHWVRAAQRSGEPDLAGAAAALAAAVGRDGLDQIAADSDRAATLLAPDSPGQALAALLAGVVADLRGDRDAARARLEDGARRATVPAPLVHALCLAQLALLALDEHDGEEAARLAARARSQVARHGLARLESSCLVLAVSGLVAAQRGRVDDARTDAREAAALLARMLDVAPWYALEAHLTLARAALRLSEVNEAREHLAAARRAAALEPGAVTAHKALEAAEQELAAVAGAQPRLTASLTTAELRILQFLPTHLSFREIAERTFVSPNTVKTQANAVYRKLDVRSRSEAVTCARALGLLDA
ncbi:MAG TPA: LuxR C-terminal-related transcriptional regulator, partial [Solirubrobacter sp.]|nr:LuxR C-terminal-related transcriptional regulator [Solirubrobacter sp.]